VAHPVQGADRVMAWRTMVEVWPNFTKYEQRTDRQIKVFELVEHPTAQTYGAA